MCFPRFEPRSSFSLLVLEPSLPRTPCSSALSAVAGLSRDYRLAFQNLNTTSMKAPSSALKLSAEPGGLRLGRRADTVARKHPSRHKHAHNKAIPFKIHRRSHGCLATAEEKKYAYQLRQLNMQVCSRSCARVCFSKISRPPGKQPARLSRCSRSSSGALNQESRREASVVNEAPRPTAIPAARNRSQRAA